MDFEAIKGKDAKDSVTGFTGKVTAIAYYIDGYVSIKLESVIGDLKEEWFSESRIEIL